MLVQLIVRTKPRLCWHILQISKILIFQMFLSNATLVKCSIFFNAAVHLFLRNADMDMHSLCPRETRKNIFTSSLQDPVQLLCLIPCFMFDEISLQIEFSSTICVQSLHCSYVFISHKKKGFNQPVMIFVKIHFSICTNTKRTRKEEGGGFQSSHPDLFINSNTTLLYSSSSFPGLCYFWKLWHFQRITMIITSCSPSVLSLFLFCPSLIVCEDWPGAEVQTQVW